MLHPNNIRPYIGLKNAEDGYMVPDPPPVLKRIKRIREHIKNLDAHLFKTLGMTKMTLAYVVQEDEQVPLAAFDPAAGYATVQEEIIAQMDHQHFAFCADNAKVWEIIVISTIRLQDTVPARLQSEKQSVDHLGFHLAPGFLYELDDLPSILGSLSSID